MATADTDRLQDLFLAALEIPECDREDWLSQQCAQDHILLSELRSLLSHASPENDPLELPLRRVILDVDEALEEHASTSNRRHSLDEHTTVHDQDFLSRLADVGVLSTKEIADVQRNLVTGDSGLARVTGRLVAQQRLTEYQASALIVGHPDLLIDKYLILDLLDSGGMGTVFKALHRPMNRIVAVKMISRRLLASQEQVQRFRREVRVAATLEHANIVRAYDADQHEGAHFLVMEYVRGDNLARLVENSGPLDVGVAVDCIYQAAQGIQFAHRHGVIHRDIKPANLMCTPDGMVKLLDLGLASIDERFGLELQPDNSASDCGQASRSADPLTGEGNLLGTASFMAPEQARDAASVDPRSDIYSLGCTLYYLLAGEAPYSGRNSRAIIESHLKSEIPTLAKLGPSVPASIDAVCRRCLAKQPEDRFQSVDEFLIALEECVADWNSEHRSQGFSSSGHNRKHYSIPTSQSPTPFRQRVNQGGLWIICSCCGLALLSFLGVRSSWPESSPFTIGAEGILIREQTVFSGNRKLATLAAGERILIKDVVGDQIWTQVVAPMKIETHMGAAKAAEFSPDGNWIVSCSEYGNALRSSATGKSGTTGFGVDDAANLCDIAFSYQGDRIVAGGLDGLVLWDATTLHQLWRRSPGNLPHDVAFSPDGQWIACAECGYHPHDAAKREFVPCVVSIWNVTTGECVLTLEGNERDVHAIAFSPDGQRIASAGKDTSIHIWEVSSGRLLTSWDSGSSVADIVFTSNTNVASTGDSGGVTIWDERRGEAIKKLQFSGAKGTALAYSRESSWTACADEDGFIRLWNMQGELLLEFKAHDKVVQGLAFDRSGHRLVTASHDSTVKTWDLGEGQGIAGWLPADSLVPLASL